MSVLLKALFATEECLLPEATGISAIVQTKTLRWPPGHVRAQGASAGGLLSHAVHPCSTSSVNMRPCRYDRLFSSEADCTAVVQRTLRSFPGTSTGRYGISLTTFVDVPTS